MAEINYDIEHQIHGRMVTCQRPIVFTVYTEDIRVVYFKAQMYIKDKYGDWIKTNVVAKGYHESKFNYFSFNVAEYVRHYHKVSKNWLNQVVCSLDDVGYYGPILTDNEKFMFQRDFYFKIWPVYNDGFGNIVEETDNEKYTRDFGVVELNTKQNEITNYSPIDRTRIDVWVNGAADGAWYDNTYGEIDYLGAKYNRFMTNMPGITQYGENDNPGPYNHIDIDDGWFTNTIIQGHNYQWNKFQRDKISVRNAASQVWTTYNIDTDWGNPYNFAGQETPSTELYYTNLNIHVLEWVLNNGIGIANYFIDGDGELVADRFSITTEIRDEDGFYRGGPKITLDLKKGDTKCGRRTKFVFKNMRGGIDWFHCYGTKEKKVDLKSTTYEQNQSFGRGNVDFGVTSGEHSKTNLWTQREERVSVFTQALGKDWAVWLEELIVSPQVWVEEDVANSHVNTNPYELLYPHNKTLIPIIIDTGSYNIYSTEDNVHYIEFKYKLSDNTLTQQGY